MCTGQLQLRQDTQQAATAHVASGSLFGADVALLTVTRVGDPEPQAQEGPVAPSTEGGLTCCSNLPLITRGGCSCSPARCSHVAHVAHAPGKPLGKSPFGICSSILGCQGQGPRGGWVVRSGRRPSQNPRPADVGIKLTGLLPTINHGF